MESLNLQLVEQRFREQTRQRAVGWRTWLCLLWATPRLTWSVLLLGLVSAAMSVATGLSMAVIAIIVYRDSTAAVLSWTVLMGFSLLGRAIFETLRQRQEMVLGLVVRFLVTRDILRSSRAGHPDSTESALLTLPRQTAQFVYVVDSLTTSIEIVLLCSVMVIVYGAAGWTSVALVFLVSAIGALLVRRVGVLWKRHIAVELERQAVLGDLTRGLPALRWGPFWSVAVTALGKIRERQEQLYRKRAPVLSIAGVFDYASVAVVVIGVLILLGPGTGDGVALLGLLPSIRIVWAAAQNNIANYRVIALAVPQLRRVDELRQQSTDEQKAHTIVFPPLPHGHVTQVVLPHSMTSDFLASARASVRSTVIVSASETIPSGFIDAWTQQLDATESEHVTHLLDALGISHLRERLTSSTLAQVSHGEACRIMVAVALSHHPQCIVLDGVLPTLDPHTRAQLRALVTTRDDVSWVFCEPRDDDFPEGTAVFRWDTGDHELPRWSTSTRVAATPVDAAAPAPSVPVRALDTDVHSIDAGLPEDASAAAPTSPTVLSYAELRRTISLLFTRTNALAIMLGALILCVVEPGLAALLSSESALNLDWYIATASALLGLIFGGTLHYLLVYLAPNHRLSNLHRDLVLALPRQCARRPLGEVLGRAGEDFSTTQMQVPAALGAAALGVLEICVLEVIMLVTAPGAAVASVIALPVYWWVLRYGESRIRRRSDDVSHERTRFLGPASDLATSRFCQSLSPGLHPLYSIIEARMFTCEQTLISALARRGALIFGLQVTLTCTAIVGAVTLAAVGGESMAVAMLIYLGCVVVPRFSSVLIPLQSMSVSLLSQQRLCSLLTSAPDSAAVPPARELRALMSSADTATALCPPRFVSVSGPSGIGKSRGLHRLAEERAGTAHEAHCYPASAPFPHAWYPPATAGIPSLRTPANFLTSKRVRQEYLRELILVDTTPIVVLDETLDDLGRADQAAWLDRARRTRPRGSLTVIVSHSEHLPQMCDSAVRLEETA